MISLTETSHIRKIARKYVPASFGAEMIALRSRLVTERGMDSTTWKGRPGRKTNKKKNVKTKQKNTETTQQGQQ